MFIICIGLIVLTIIFVLLSKDADIKKQFNIPFYYHVIDHDLGKKPKSNIINYNGVYGCPDAIFKAPCFPIYIIGEAKSRNCNQIENVLSREQYQLVLYMGIIKKKHSFSYVRGVFRFRNEVIPLSYSPKTFNMLMKLKLEAIRTNNCLRRQK